MSEPLVHRTDRGGVATIELNRPERKNSIIAPMLDELTDHVESASRDPGIGAVLLCGAGGAFCSGLDLTEYNADPPPAWLATAPESIRAAHVAIGSCPHPVVVALERYAINGGAAFALAGDLIVTGTNAWLQVGEARLGMHAPMNLAWLVARYPMSTVLQIVLAGDRVAGPDLHRLGIAHEVEPHLLVRLAQRRGLERGVARREAAAGQPDLAAPWITLARGAADQQQLGVAGGDGMQDQRDRGLVVRLVPLGKTRRMACDRSGDPLDERTRHLGGHPSTGPSDATQAFQPPVIAATFSYPICCIVSAASAERLSVAQ